MKRRILTIGHSNYDIDTFIQRLQLHHVAVLVDVRSHPYSRYLPHFTKAPLQAALEKTGIQYLFLGHELGARPTDASCYDATGKALYEKIAATAAFAAGIAQLLQVSESIDGSEGANSIALMCAEKDPLTCHRAILVCPHLPPSQIEIHHIQSNGNLESQFQLEERLLAKHGFRSQLATATATQLDLFAALFAQQPTREDCLQTAYRLQGEAIAYVEKSAEVIATAT